MKTRPHLIGVMLDVEPPSRYSMYRWYALRATYNDAFAGAGGVPEAQPHLAVLADSIRHAVAGLVVTGGSPDVGPALYGNAPRHPSISLKPERVDADLALVKGSQAGNKPIPGVCGGQQPLGEAWGGKLIQHPSTSFPASLGHEQPKPRRRPRHTLSIESAFLVQRMTRAATMYVDPACDPGVGQPAACATVTTSAPDSAIEGQEEDRYRFCLRVHWQPEILINPSDASRFGSPTEVAWS